ncbi:MAG: hypothetical protein ACTSVZ_08070 [Promethearchaeota archaeon]
MKQLHLPDMFRESITILRDISVILITIIRQLTTLSLSSSVLILNTNYIKQKLKFPDMGFNIPLVMISDL